MLDLSIIICTYNPSKDIFKKCLYFLERACKKIKNYEILIIDNNSLTPLSKLDYVNQFRQKQQQCNIILEKKQGLTPARLRGIKEANGKLLVFIDDDNFINEDFLEVGLNLSHANQHIGAFSGQVDLVFEEAPPIWTKPYWGLLVYRKLEKDVWSNLPHLTDTMPCGAGLFVRKEVAKYYLQLHTTGKRKIQLDRNKNSLFSGGDNDLAACACDIGLGVALFQSLKLQHFIPQKRLSTKYLLNLAEGISASTIIFKSFRGEFPSSPSMKNKIANFLRLVLKTGFDRKIFLAVLRGERKGKEILQLSHNEIEHSSHN